MSLRAQAKRVAKHSPFKREMAIEKIFLIDETGDCFVA
jgi:hypothetical protein